MELYKAFYWKGGVHPNSGNQYNYVQGWYWWAKDKYGSDRVHLMCQSRFNHNTGKRDWILTKKAAVRGARSDASRRHWGKIWQAAFENMPVRVRHIKVWLDRAPGETPLPEFIKGEAKGTHRLVDGQVQRRGTEEVMYGRLNALARCMGFVLSKDGKTPNHNWVNNSMNHGARPRDPAKRERLLELAGENGKQKAYEILTSLGIRHWYV